jgi:hypothetical protein
VFFFAGVRKYSIFAKRDEPNKHRPKKSITVHNMRKTFETQQVGSAPCGAEVTLCCSSFLRPIGTNEPHNG